MKVAESAKKEVDKMNDFLQKLMPKQLKLMDLLLEAEGKILKDMKLKRINRRWSNYTSRGGL